MPLVCKIILGITYCALLLNSQVVQAKYKMAPCLKDLEKFTADVKVGDDDPRTTQEIFQANDMEAYYTRIMSQPRTASKMSLYMDKWRAALMRKRGNQTIPSLYQNSYQGTPVPDDIRQAIKTLTDYTKIDEEEVDAAISTIEGRLDFNSNFENFVWTDLEVGFDAKAQIAELTPFMNNVQKTKKHFKKHSKLKVKLTDFDNRGGVTKINQEFSTFEKLEKYFNDQLNAFRHIFTHTIFDRWFFKSELDEKFMLQVANWRIIKSGHNRLTQLPAPPTLPTPEAQQLLDIKVKKIKKLVKKLKKYWENPVNAPTQRYVDYIVKREFITEVTDMFGVNLFQVGRLSNIARRSSSKWRITEEGMARIKKISYSFMTLLALGGGFGIYRTWDTAYEYARDTKGFGVWLAETENQYDQILRDMAGNTGEQDRCGEQHNRELFIDCYVGLTLRYIQEHIVKSKGLDPGVEKDKKTVDRIDKFATGLLMSRREENSAKAAALVRKRLTVAAIKIVKKDLSALVAKTFNGRHASFEKLFVDLIAAESGSDLYDELIDQILAQLGRSNKRQVEELIENKLLNYEQLAWDVIITGYISDDIKVSFAAVVEELLLINKLEK
ncbi:MAG: hypothetical protein ISR65_10930 [Bacteriovoracaceae bacterium]|nr:hypothetical protein [Bacteriovoracaceae bacterium]